MLKAEHFRVRDRVIGEADGESLFGEIVQTDPHWIAQGDVCVRWAGDPDPDPCLVPAELLRLWPARAHAARLAQIEGAGT